MDEEGFKAFLKRGGRSQSALTKAVLHVREFEQFLQEHKRVTLDNAVPEDLNDFAEWVERTCGVSAKMHLWAICYYYEYTANENMSDLAGELRAQRTSKKRKPFRLKDFRGVNYEYVEKLGAAKIKTAEQMREAGKTTKSRQELSVRTGVPLEVITELVKLSDLARIPGVKSIRARLYYEAGVDTVEKMAEWDPEALRAVITEFVERTGFEGIPPTPKEAKSTVETARKLPKIVEYQ